MRRLAANTAKALMKMRVDVFVVGEDEGYVVAPADSWLPLDEMKALGALRFGWTIDTSMAMPKLDWHTIAKDIDARGYSIVASHDVGGLLAIPQQNLRAIYPEHHPPFAA
ncbi:hypothetical protein GLA29479_1504 [Lysobacter antibioticus]|jgi:hypothetical protein|uniref:Uncharacterized protein n=2 Tax=Lysobacteraceae TaxID=32033 RepID=A0A0S2F9K8_LYSAN|nr:hypothetical protein GLA29479_1504 [Lysobacter antibioticus]ALN80141.1 hypothetical protein LA76x_1998 [Lysobacter antibioticus]